MKRELFKLKANLSHWMFDNLDNLRLCFVRDNVAFFTTLPLEQQRGNNWEYESAFQIVSSPTIPSTDSFGKPRYGLLVLIWESNVEYINPIEELSVVNIKKVNTTGTIPWLKGKDLKVYPGTSARDFIDFLLKSEQNNTLPNIY